MPGLRVSEERHELFMEARSERTSPPDMVAPWHSPELSDTLSDLSFSEVSLCIRASAIIEAGPERDWDVADRRDVDQLCLRLTSQIIGSILLEPVLQGVLGPVNVAPDRGWLAVGVARGVVTDLLIEVVADGLEVLIPVGASERVDAIVLEVEQAVLVDMGAFVHRDGARVEGSEAKQVVLEEAVLDLSEDIEHLHCALARADI